MHIIVNFITYNQMFIPIAPKIPKCIKCEVKEKLLSSYAYKKNKITLGILKFKCDNKIYIHCPLKKIKDDGKIKFGVCRNFTSLEDSLLNRQKLCTHKFRYHYGSDKNKSKRLKLQVSKSIEEVLQNTNT